MRSGAAVRAQPGSSRAARARPAFPTTHRRLNRRNEHLPKGVTRKVRRSIVEESAAGSASAVAQARAAAMARAPAGPVSGRSHPPIATTQEYAAQTAKPDTYEPVVSRSHPTTSGEIELST